MSKKINGDGPSAQALKRARKAYDNAKYRCGKPGCYEDVKFALPSFKDFISVLGLPKPGQTLDRIDPNGHYEIGNVRWTNKSVQAANKKASTGGSTAPLSVIVEQAQQAHFSCVNRQTTAGCWMGLIAVHAGIEPSGRQRKAMSERGVAALLSQDSFSPGDIEDLIQVPGVFHLPSLTDPAHLVRVRGGPFQTLSDFSPREMELRRARAANGIILRLGKLEIGWNASSHDIAQFEHDLKSTTSAGACWVGRPSKISLLGGWFEGKMLAIASRLSWLRTTAVVLPASIVLEQIERWNEPESELRTAEFLFIPDFQVDAGPYWRTSNDELFKLAHLIKSRVADGKKSFVGIQSPQSLPHSVSQTLLSRLQVRQFEGDGMPHPDRSEIVDANNERFAEFVKKRDNPVQQALASGC